MDRQTGYLACIDNIPPLIFRFQFNPDILSDKKSFKYKQGEFGKWGFDKAHAASGFTATLSGLWTDVKEIGSLISNTKPLQPDGGDDRAISIDFSLDASRPGPMDGDDHYGGSIAPDLDVLRSFMYPAFGLGDLPDVFKGTAHWTQPPQCSLVYGGISVTCVMTDLNIKITAFQDDGSPLRADVSVTLKEQTFSPSPIMQFVTREVNVALSYNRKGFGSDVIAVTPGASAIAGLFH